MIWFMPTRNRVKIYVPDVYYHVYNRGWNRSEIFIDDDDYNYFESLLVRHLSVKNTRTKRAGSIAGSVQLSS